LSAGQIAGGVVGSLAAALGIAAGLIFMLILRRKRDAHEPSCHEAEVEDLEGDTADYFSEVLTEGCSSFSDDMDEMFLRSCGELNSSDAAED
jgi:hypothetical protein